MRWLVTLVTLSLGVWYLTNRRRRGQLQETVEDVTPGELQARAWNMATTVSDAAQDLAQTASKTAGDAVSNGQQAAGSVTDRAQQAVDAATQGQGAQQGAGTGTGATQQTTDASPASGNAVETDVNTPPPSIHETVQAEMADVDEQVDRLRAQSEAPPDPAEKSAGEVFGAGTMATTDGHAAQAPATAREAETVEGGVEPLNTADQAPEGGTTAAAVMREGGMGSAAPSASSMSSTGGAATSKAPATTAPEAVGMGTTGDLSVGATPSGPANTVGDETPATGANDVTPSVSTQGSAAPTTDERVPTPTTPIEAIPAAAPASAPSDGGQGTTGRTLTTDDSIVPEGERPRPIAGEGTTTAGGGMVDTLSPVGDGPTATGKPEPLPQGLTAGEPGTGGPAASTIAPSTPDSVEAPTTGMETAPVVDRAAEVTKRTGGKLVGNKKTRVFHLASAGDLPGESNRVYFDSVEEATGAGFTPAPHVDFRDL